MFELREKLEFIFSFIFKMKDFHLNKYSNLLRI